MIIDGASIVITGAGNGIGRALAKRFAAENARAIALMDIDGDNAQAVAAEIGGIAYTVDVTDEDAYRKALDAFATEYGPIDLLCSNAGIAVGGGPEASNADWERCWQVNVMSHVYGARAVLPSTIERRSGYLLQTVSAAGLLNNIGAMPYAVTKHAAIGLAEWLHMTYGHLGLKVSCLCPQGVYTNMLDSADALRPLLEQGAISTEVVADATVEGLRAESFLILPHPEVGNYLQFKAGQYDRWLTAMQGLQAQFKLDPAWPSVN